MFVSASIGNFLRCFKMVHKTNVFFSYFSKLNKNNSRAALIFSNFNCFELFVSYTFICDRKSYGRKLHEFPDLSFKL